MLSERRQRVLRALIEDYIEYALPVGSRTLTERHRLGVSPATVRNDLSALEDAGFIQQPHTSAGRVPTDAGYRTFVDELLSSGLAEEERPHQAMVDELRASASELDALMERTSAALARLTNCLSIVMAPSVLAGRIRQITLVSLSPWQAIVIVVAEDGQVVNRTVTFADEVSADELAGAQNLLNRVLAGHSARDVRRSMDAGTVEALSDPLVQLIIDEVIECLGESESARRPQPRRLGASAPAGVQRFEGPAAGHRSAGGRPRAAEHLRRGRRGRGAGHGAHRAREPRLGARRRLRSWPAPTGAASPRASSPSSAPPA